MSKIDPIFNNFTAGEISPLLAGAVNLDKFASGCQTMENFLSLTHGPASFRQGMRFIAETKTSTKKSRLIPFEFSTTQAYILEFGDLYIRVYKDRGQIAVKYDTGSKYDTGIRYDVSVVEIVTPYLEADLPTLKYVQSADVLYLTHPNYPPKQLSRTSHTAWTLTDYNFRQDGKAGPFLDENTTPITLTPITNNEMPPYAGDGSQTVFPYIFKILADTDLRVYLTNVLGVKTLLTLTTHYSVSGAGSESGGNVTMVTPPATGETLTIIKEPPTTEDGITVIASAPLFNAGHVDSIWRIKHGTTWGVFKVTAFTDSTHVNAMVITTLGGITAVTTWREGAWSAYRGFPSCLSFYEERLFFAATPNQPQTIWGSKSGDYVNFAPEDTITDSGPFSRTIASNEVNPIYWLIPARILIAGTAGGEFKISGSTSGAPLTPTNVAIREDTAYGVANIKPQAVGNVILFVQRHGRKLRELTYDFASDSYVAPDLTILNEHLTYPWIIDMAFMRDPFQILWSVRSDGVLLPMIYERSEKVVGWTRQVTDGMVESVATIPGPSQTEVWLIVKRVIGGVTKRYVELLEDFINANTAREDYFFVDSGLTYDGAPATVISGLNHLEGKEVAVLADGAVHPRKTVTSGRITLDYAASVVQAGLPYVGTFVKRYFEGGSQQGTSQAKIRRIYELAVRLDNSFGGKVGPDADNLEPLCMRSVGDVMDTSPPMVTGDVIADFRGVYDTPGQIMIKQDLPLPFTICALMPRLTVMEG